jgi:hypothetical protein
VVVSRISLVSPERSRQIESILLRMAQSGQLKSRVTEDQLIGLLEQVRGASSFRPVLLTRLFAQAEEARGATKKSTIVVRSDAFSDPLGF